MSEIKYNSFEQKLIKKENMNFIKLLIERDVKNYKYDVKFDNIVDYVHRSGNSHLYNEIQKYNITDSELNDIRASIIETSKYNLDIEYLPTEDWEFNDISGLNNELIIALPTYEMFSNGLALFILIFPFASLFLSYFLIMIFR